MLFTTRILFQYACGGEIEPVIIGKPSSRYFLTALQDMNVKPEEVGEILNVIFIDYIV